VISRDAFDDLVTGAEIARRLAISPTRVSQLAQRPTFPRPLGRLGHATIWRWADIERWAELTDRLPLSDAARTPAAIQS
jgi:predicted DNA-binding transcriptional regulator AlpA